MKAETRRTLELFIAKAEEMQAAGFIAYLEANPIISFSFDSNKGITSKTAPTSELINSFATCYRIFTSKKEPVSTWQLAKLSENDVSQEWRNDFRRARSELNTLLDNNTRITKDGTHYTKRYIADIFINGWIFHVKDPTKTTIYLKWKKNPFGFSIFEQEFIETMYHVATIIQFIADISRKELNRYG